jgi:predicted nucleic acid-binding protein
MAVIDASVYVALINTQEQDHATSRAWFQQTLAAQGTISAPAILLAEVAAALSRGTGNQDLALRVVDQLLRAQLVELVPITTNLAERAAAIAAAHRIRGCDATYVALADQLGDELVTLDRQQLERGSTVIPTHRPND